MTCSNRRRHAHQNFWIARRGPDPEADGARRSDPTPIPPATRRIGRRDRAACISIGVVSREVVSLRPVAVVVST